MQISANNFVLNFGVSMFLEQTKEMTICISAYAIYFWYGERLCVFFTLPKIGCVGGHIVFYTIRGRRPENMQFYAEVILGRTPLYLDLRNNAKLKYTQINITFFISVKVSELLCRIRVWPLLLAE